MTRGLHDFGTADTLGAAQTPSGPAQRHQPNLHLFAETDRRRPWLWDHPQVPPSPDAQMEETVVHRKEGRSVKSDGGWLGVQFHIKIIVVIVLKGSDLALGRGK